MQLVLSSSPGGAARLVGELCRRLAADVETVVACLDEPGEWAAEISKLNIPVISLNLKPGFHPSLSVRLAEVIKGRRINVIHCHHYSPFVYGLLAAVMHPSVRLVFTDHGSLHGVAASSKRRLVNPVLARWPSTICAVSAVFKQQMVDEGFPERSIQVVYDGIELGRRPNPADRAAMRASMRLGPDDFVIGAVGGLESGKSLGALIDALALLTVRYPAAKVVIVGGSAERQALEARASALGIGAAIVFAENQGGVRTAMAAFDVYVNCSTFEAVSLSVLEAMASALPVVASAVGGNSEAVIDHETGRLVRPQAAAIAAAVGALIEHPERRQAMGDAARWRVKRHFTIERLVGDYAAAYSLPRTAVVSTAGLKAAKAAG